MTALIKTLKAKLAKLELALESPRLNVSFLDYFEIAKDFVGAEHPDLMAVDCELFHNQVRQMVSVLKQHNEDYHEYINKNRWAIERSIKALKAEIELEESLLFAEGLINEITNRKEH